MELRNIGHKEMEDIEARLEAYDEQHMGEVQEEYRRRGLGKALLHEAEKRAAGYGSNLQTKEI